MDIIKVNHKEYVAFEDYDMLSNCYKEISKELADLQERYHDLVIRNRQLSEKNELLESDSVELAVRLYGNVKAKLTLEGVREYYVYYDGKMPVINSDGYTEFRLIEFMDIFGRKNLASLIQPLEIYAEHKRGELNG